MQDFKKLRVWEKAHALTVEIYTVSRRFPKDELFALTNQLRRASSSIGANIAEGSGRTSRKEFLHFLSYAIGSTSEVEYFLILAKDIKYLSGSEFPGIYDRVNEVRRGLISFYKRIDTE